jgi:uncharacterized protein YegP (UPF0339 family)/outer membrane murein-binding lipoprotein Lpp
MTLLFVQLTQTVTGNVITIVALNLAAAIIGFAIAWFYAKSVYTPKIKGLTADKNDLNNQVARLKNDFNNLNEKVNKLSEKTSKLEEESAEKDKELNNLSAEALNIGKFVISIAKNDESYFNLKATNGQTILTSDMYSSKAACFNGIESVINNCSDDDKYDRKLSANEKHYFNLKASNGQVIGKSQMYESEAGMEKGIASVKRNGITTIVVEEYEHYGKVRGCKIKKWRALL